MVTMKDIAKKAGVSYGTVSNVLNKRGKTSLKKIKLVEDAAKELGYFYNENASSLRSNIRNDVALIIPTIDSQFYCKLFNLLNYKLNALNIKFNIYISSYNSAVEMSLVKNLIAINKYIIIISCMDDFCEFYQNLASSDANLIFINSKQYPQNISYSSIYFQYNQFYEDINNYVNKNGYKDVLLLSTKSIFSQNVIKATSISEYVVLPSNIISTTMEKLYQKEYELIVTTSNEITQEVMNAKRIIQRNLKTPIVSIMDLDNNFDNNIKPYYQDTDAIIKNIIDIIKNSKNKIDINIPFIGFFEDTKTYNKDEYINILLMANPSSNALIKIKPFIEKKLGFKLNIDLMSYDHYDLLFEEKYVEKYDLIRIDMAHIKTLADKLFIPLNDKIALLKNRFIDNLEEYVYVDNKAYALPFDISSMVLMYRKDIFDNQIVKRSYYEQTKKNLCPPKTFKEYNEIERFFAKNYKGLWYPSTTCLGSSLTTSNEFLLRVNKNYIFEDDNLDFNNPDIKEALDSYLCSIKNSKNSNNMFWDDVANDYSSGNVIMSIIYSNYIYLLQNHKEILFKTDFINTPTNYSYIGGGIIGLTKNTKKENLIYNFLDVLYSDEICKLLTHLGASMPVKSVYDNISLTFNYPWLKLLPEALLNGKRQRKNSSNNDIEIIYFEKNIGRQVKSYINKNI